MNIHFTPGEERFRQTVRDFLADNLPARLADAVARGAHLTKAELEEWHAILNEQGWLAAHWPKEHGGTGWTVVEKYIFEVECALANAPRIVPFGLSMLGPVLIKFGTTVQKNFWLPRILDGSDWWCQGYSEPGAGSDLAALRTTAVRRDREFIVNGQKTWTTQAHFANMMFALVRTGTDGKKQAGISFLLIDMNAPGVEVRPIITLDGAHEVNEVFFTDVRVPVANLVGEENFGWTCAKYLLTYERTNIAGVGQAQAMLRTLKRLSSRPGPSKVKLSDDPYFAARVARVEIEVENMRTTTLRVISAASAAGGSPGAESSMLKIRGSEIRQELSSLILRAMGPSARQSNRDEQPGDRAEQSSLLTEAAAANNSYFNNRKLSIYGGSNEVQRNIIAKSILAI